MMGGTIPDLLLLVGLMGVLGLVWAFLLGRQAVKENDIWERILWAALAFLGALALAPALVLAVGMIAGPLHFGFFGAVGIWMIVMTPAGGAYLVGTGILAVVVVARRLRARTHRRA